MKGASGATLRLTGDVVRKRCSNALDQAKWFSLAERVGFPRGLRVPAIYSVSDNEYEMEFIEGHEATRERSLFAIKLLCNWILNTCANEPTESNSWGSYLERLEQHVRLADSKVMRQALCVVCKLHTPRTSFSHGDLTLENILVTSKELVLIDPNYSPGLFSSYILDVGKLMQSTHFNYHKVFNSNHGVELDRHRHWLELHLKQHDIWQESIIACISHIIRLRKYRPESERKLVDQRLEQFIRDYA